MKVQTPVRPIVLGWNVGRRGCGLEFGRFLDVALRQEMKDRGKILLTIY